MPSEYDVVIIGAGHNGLVTAGYLARAGLRTLVLECRRVVGGACVTEEVFPGYKFSTTSYLCSLMQEKVTKDLGLEKFGFAVYPKNPAFFSPFPDGRYLILWSDTGKTCDEIRKFSARDAEQYPHYEEYLDRLVRFIEPLLLETPPDIAPRGFDDWQKLAGLGRRVIRMTAEELVGHLRILSQSVEDFLEPVVRIGAAQGGARHRWRDRHQRRPLYARHGLRALPSLHGRGGRQARPVGIRARRHGRPHAGDGRVGRIRWGRDSHRRACCAHPHEG
jgi:hypothetical protein